MHKRVVLLHVAVYSNTAQGAMGYMGTVQGADPESLAFFFLDIISISSLQI